MNTLKITASSSSESPREMAEHFSIMAYKHRSYCLGEETIGDPIDWLESKLNVRPQGIYSTERLSELEERFYSDFIALPLYLYDHGGLSISTTPFSCRWDSGKVGYIYVSKETVRKEYSVKVVSKKTREKVLEVLEAEIKEYDTYLTEGYYSFSIEDENEDEVDGCSGFLGTDWENNGILDYIVPKHLGLTTREEVLELINNTEIEY